jgi:hypothetical protein
MEPYPDVFWIAMLIHPVKQLPRPFRPRLTDRKNAATENLPNLAPVLINRPTPRYYPVESTENVNSFTD